MKKNKKTIIAAVLFWIPLAIVVYSHSTEESLLMRIVLSVIAFPVAVFEAMIAALAFSALSTGSVYILRNLEAFDIDKDCNLKEVFVHSFNGACGISIAIAYFLTITNQHIFIRLYGGW